MACYVLDVACQQLLQKICDGSIVENDRCVAVQREMRRKSECMQRMRCVRVALVQRQLPINQAWMNVVVFDLFRDGYLNGL